MESTPGDRATGQRLRGALLVLASGVTLSTKAVLAKLAYHHGVDALSIVTLRMLFAMPFFVLSAFLAERRAATPMTRRDLVLVGGLGLLGYYVSAMLDFLGLMYVSAGLERLVLYLYPTFVILISRLLFRAKLRGPHLVALVITYAGIAIVFRHEQNLSGQNVKLGLLLVLGCSIGYAGYLVGGGRLIPRVGAQRFNAYSLLAATLGICVHWLAFGRSLRGLPLPVYGYGFLMATLATVLPTLLMAKGMALVGAGPASILTMIGPISTILLAHVLLNEPITIWQSLGGALVILGVLLVTVRK